MWHRSWSWLAEGFLRMPDEKRPVAPLRAYRVWGGVATERGNPGGTGLFLTLDRPRSRREAELKLSVFEYGNTCRWITTYEIAAGVPVFVGVVHPGDAHLNPFGSLGSQLLIEHRHVTPTTVRKIGVAEALVDDMPGVTIVPNRSPARGGPRWS